MEHYPNTLDEEDLPDTLSEEYKRIMESSDSIEVIDIKKQHQLRNSQNAEFGRRICDIVLNLLKSKVDSNIS